MKETLFLSLLLFVLAFLVVQGCAIVNAATYAEMFNRVLKFFAGVVVFILAEKGGGFI